jgi:hypothetical protein
VQDRQPEQRSGGVDDVEGSVPKCGARRETRYLFPDALGLRPGTTFDRAWRELAVAKQVNLVLANMFWAEAIGRTVEVPREILHRMDIGTRIRRRRTLLFEIKNSQQLIDNKFG